MATKRHAFSLSLPLLVGCVAQEGGVAPPLEPILFTQQDLHIIGTSDTIAGIVDLMPLDDGSAWVLNDTEPFLVRLSPEGELLRAQGIEGGGPGEFFWPSTLVRDEQSGDVWVYEARQGRFVRVEESAAAPLAVALPHDSSGIPRLSSYEYLWMSNGGRTWVRNTGDGFVFARASAAVPWIYSLWSTDVVRLRGDGSYDTVLSTEDVVGSPDTRFPGATRFLPYPMWSACPNGSLAVYDPNRNALRRFTASGDSLTTHDLPPRREVEITPETIFETVHPGVLRNRAWGTRPDADELRRLVRRDYQQRADEFSDVFPEYADLDCVGTDTLWVQPFDTTSGEMGRGPHWLRVTAEGAEGTVEFPPTFRPMRFHGGRVWGVHRGEFDVEHLAWTELPD